MTARKKIESRPCAACGGTAIREIRKRTIRYGGEAITIDQPAWWCQDCGEGMLDSKDAAIADRAFATLKARKEGVLTPVDIENIRKRLGLSQRQAGTILGGGARSFQRYEAGAVVVSKPMSNLLRLLDHQPDLLAQLTAQKVHQTEIADRRRVHRSR